MAGQEKAGKAMQTVSGGGFAHSGEGQAVLHAGDSM